MHIFFKLNVRNPVSAAPLAAIALAGALAFGSAGVQAQAAADGAYSHATGRVLVMPRAGLSDKVLDKLLRENGGGQSRRIGKTALRVVDVPSGQAQRLVERLARHPHLKFVELDHRVGPDLQTNDPLLGSQWHLSQVGAPAAWDAARGTGVTIAILDTGVDGAHPDLVDRLVAGWNIYDNNANTADVHGHGTAVAGSAAATMNNGSGVASVAGESRIMPVRISAPDGYAYWSTVAQGITWAADRGAKVANVSYGGVTGSASVQSAAQYMKSKGGLVVVAAGNNGIAESIAPTTAMITVSATDSADMRASWSSFGSFVSLAAPGVGIYTTTRGGGYGAWSGTSFASPVTAGVVSLVMSANPLLAAAEVEQLLYTTARDLGAAGRDDVFGWGRVDAAAAVSAALTVVPDVDTQPPTTSILAPLGFSTVSGLVPVDVAATDNRGVSRVDLKVGNVVVASDTAAPYAFTWDSALVANGTATLVALAYDTAGNVGASIPVAVTVANAAVADTTPPTITILNPGNGTQVSGNVAINLAASDDSGSAGIVQSLFIDNVKVSTASGGEMVYRWNTRKVSSGNHSIRAEAVDAAGNVSVQTISVRR